MPMRCLVHATTGTTGTVVNWWPVYGTAVSLSCAVSVVFMAKAIHRMRKHVDAMHNMVFPTVFAAAQMWDTLTPEQIRTLHPMTVEVANGLPPWSHIAERIPHERGTNE